MIVNQYKEMLQMKSVIREVSGSANERAKIIGADKVYNYSLGNPSVPAPTRMKDVMMQLLEERDALDLHGYSPSYGLLEARENVAAYLSESYQLPYQSAHIFMTSGAASAIAHAVRAVVNPGEDVITFSPFFPEYVPYIKETGANLKVIPSKALSFQIDLDILEKEITENTAAILINSPNNPTGVVYKEDVLQDLACLLKKKQQEYGHTIFIISDEPYREIVFHGVQLPCISKIYENTIMCYSFSKSLSIPGERIGYIAVSPHCEDATLIIDMCTQISRGIGHNCPSSLIQLAVSQLLGETSELRV